MSTFDPRELIAAFEEALGNCDGEGMTTEELAASKGWPRTWADRFLREQARTGKLVASKKQVMTRAGYAKAQPCYRLKE